ncbi:hypothetical protein TCAL_15644 [Tigriopus californicus]|uniref:Uncharacterized protein n=1 Tax=Tigriopus californicus TaxID=6832 RepID=A0A553PC22_TIGCA|nr:hypothetical protein TCAL_15644 [Tigriopus californicus]
MDRKGEDGVWLACLGNNSLASNPPGFKSSLGKVKDEFVTVPPTCDNFSVRNARLHFPASDERKVDGKEDR